MTAEDGEARGWRARWVGRENERRRMAYEAALQAWRRRDEKLRQLYTEAEEPTQRAETPAGLPVQFDDDEIVLAVEPAAELVEVTARHTAGLPTATLTVVPLEDGSTPQLRGVSVVDAGTAVVTDRRLLIVGRDEQEEWPYAQVAGIAHHPGDPFTLLHAKRPGRIRGVRVPRAAASAFRLRLTVAYADATGAREALLDRLDDAAVDHWHDQPPAPTPATPADAPLTARLLRPALVTAVAVALAIAAVAGVVHGSLPDRPVIGMKVDGGTGVEPTGPGVPSASTALGAPGSSTTPSATGTTSDPPPGATPGTAAPTSAAPTSATTTSATTTPATGGPRNPPSSPRATGTPAPTSPSPTPADRCGAPANPYGYNYCGGSYVYDPASDVCDYFACVNNLWNGNGYLVQCEDGLTSRTGMKGGGCAEHGGLKRPIYAA
ncbi:hypothetical protein AB0E12_04490 [Micromonospora chersina]|uniref:hypothetical protein n=1 Tax=Micromonospora chersina TaxID=47854 RepID=UPI0033E80FCA